MSATRNFKQTHPLDKSSFLCQSSGEGATGVPLVIEPAHLLAEHGLEGDGTQPGCQVLPRHCETDHLIEEEEEEVREVCIYMYNYV